MIFFVLNLILGIGLIFFSMYVELDDHDLRSKAFVNLVLSLGTVELFMLVVFWALFKGNVHFVRIGSMLMMFALAIFFVGYLNFAIQFPNYKKSVPLSVFKYLLWAFAAICVVKIGVIQISPVSGVFLSPANMIGDFLPWSTLFENVFMTIIPLLTVLIFMLKLRLKISAHQKQQAIVMIGGMVLASGLHYLINLASITVPFYQTLFPLCLACIIIITYIAGKVTIMFDFATIINGALRVVIPYIIPSLLSCVIFALLMPIRRTMPLVFLLLLFADVGLALFLQHFFRTKYAHMSFAKDSYYEDELDAALANFDYKAPYDELTENFVNLMKNNLETNHVELLMNDDSGMLKSAYTSMDMPSKPIAMNSALVDFLAGVNREVVFKSHVMSHHDYSTQKDELLKLFDSIGAEVILLLRESHHLFGMIAFGPKRRGNAFSDYDYKALTNLYSYFFLFGYYMKNIANQSLVGTVAREIQMSSQVIRSIQDNVDAFKDPSVDVGYISRSARSLGGDFIDFIRLTDTRHMLIMGDVSGKGLNASMSMVILKSIIRTLLAETTDFKDLIEKVNHFIKYNLPRGTFFAGVFAIFDFKEHIMYYVNCGLPVLFRYTEQYGNVVEIQGEGKVLGFAKKVSGMVKVRHIPLEPGDIILACTDGLLDSESLRGEQYGKERVQRLIMDNKAYESSRLVNFVYDDMLQFTSKELQDDVTAVAIRVLKQENN